MRINWTKEPPISPGYYWWAYQYKNTYEIQLWWFREGHYYTTNPNYYYSVDPIEIPEPPVILKIEKDEHNAA